jgi:hypothetical protein
MPAGPKKGSRPETNHERTLSVRYVFRNHLIWGEKHYLSRKENA